MSVFTSDNSYYLPVKPRIKFKTKDGLTTYYTFDAFDLPAANINITYCDVDAGKGESGTAIISVEDYTNTIDLAKLLHQKVYIELGKTQGTLSHFFIGYADRVTVQRPQSNRIVYNVTAFGSQIQANELFISAREASKIQAVDDPRVTPDVKFNINQIVERILTDNTYRPRKDSSIEDLTGWAITGISNKCKLNFPTLNFPITYLSFFLDELCNTAGYRWFIDVSTGSEVFTLELPENLHSGITIKSGDLKSITSDLADKTAYFNSPFDIENDATIEVGSATSLLTTSIIDRVVVASSNKATGSTTTTNKAICQEFIINEDTRRITDIALIMSKVGEPESPKSRVNGRIVLDNGGKPTGELLAKFEIPLSQIEPTPQTIFINDLEVNNRFLTGANGQIKCWIKIYQRSGTSGNPNTDNANTIRWHHSNIFNTAQTLKSGTAPGGDRELDDKLVWSVSSNGPIYAFSVFANIRRLQAKTNLAAKNAARLKESMVDTSFISDPTATDSYLTNLLDLSSKARRGLNSFLVTIPNNFLFRPYKYVTVSDGQSGISGDFEIQRARYVFDQNRSYGCYNCELTLSAAYIPILAAFPCDS